MSTILLLLLPFFLFTVTVYGLTDRSVPDIFYPFGADFGDSILPDSDGASSPALDISTGFPFLFGNFSTVYVSTEVRLLQYAMLMCFVTVYCTVARYYRRLK